MTKCEHCGLDLNEAHPYVKMKWELCPTCQALSDEAGTTREMVGFAWVTNATLMNVLKQLHSDYRSKLTVDNLPHLPHWKVDVVKILFDTESTSWDLWEARCADLYTNTHDGTMYHVGVVTLRNANIKARIALMREMCEELT